jgi:hypothetical protein
MLTAACGLTLSACAPSFLPGEANAPIKTGQTWAIEGKTPAGTVLSWSAPVTVPKRGSGGTLVYETSITRAPNRLETTAFFYNPDDDGLEVLVNARYIFLSGAQSDVHICIVENPSKSATPNVLSGSLATSTQQLDAYVENGGPKGLNLGTCTMTLR